MTIKRNNMAGELDRWYFPWKCIR